ncbi:Ankyrin repeat containing protein [Pseudohyphozyma bogoriensis]|nr:Ankyrin repeat containing protein [Pseudohyphozyma bogoriensis]
MSTYPTPSTEQIDELILCARYGEADDLADLKTFVETYGPHWLAEAKDERGNTCLHMAGGNGHVDIVSYLLPLLPIESLSATNNALSTPLHWIALNYHLPVLRLLCPLLPPSALTLKNAKGKTAVQEAEEACESWIVEEGGEQSERGRERVRREVAIGYLLGCMGLGVKKGGEDEEGKEGEDEVISSKDVDKKMEELAETIEKVKVAPEPAPAV